MSTEHWWSDNDGENVTGEKPIEVPLSPP